MPTCVILNCTTKYWWNKQVMQKSSTKISDVVRTGTQEETERKAWDESYRKPFNSIKKETLIQVFSCEFCEVSKNTFFIEHLWATASKCNERFRQTPCCIKMKVKKISQTKINDTSNCCKYCKFTFLLWLYFC